MNTSEDEPSSGLNGRLRPRKFNASPKTTKALRKLDAKPPNEKPKRTGTPSKASPNKSDDLLNKSESDVLPISQVLCSYCDKTFVSRQAAGKHTRRLHTSTSKQDSSIHCLFCNHAEIEPNEIIRHMVDSHPNQYFACLNCHSRFSSTSELAEHKLNVCEKQKPHYRNKSRQQIPKKTKSRKIDGRNEFRTDDKEFPEDNVFNGIVISCELKPARVHDEADIEDNITTNLILPPSKNVGNATVIEKNAVIVLDDLQWNKRIPPNFNFHNTDADQILSRLGVVHRGPRTGEPNRRDWLKIIDETNQKFERCFDTTFYSKVASNVQENLAKFLDGSCNFNPDPDNTIKTRKSKNSVAINTAEGFPILLAFEQYSRNVLDGYMPRSIAPKHKWKWDNLEHDKTLLSPEQIKRDSHANNCIITLVSSLDIWTQLCMRQKFEDKFKSSPLEKKAEKQSIIGKELKEILEKRELPAPSSQVVKYVNPTSTKRDDLEFPASLGLAPATPNHDFKPAVLSGEWVRPRCYICCACGSKARDSRALSSHITTQHPNAQIQHYEIVGDVLLNSDISKHLYVPPSQVNNRTRPLRGYRECTKCKKSITLEDLHQHMLDCAGDTPTVRRKCRTARPFGVRKRRPRLPDNTIRKEIRKDIRSRHRKNLIRPRQKNRSEVGDAETIRKMLADLPAKRHRVLVNPLNSNLRPRRKFNKQRSIIKMKKKLSEDGNKKGQPHNTASHVNAGNDRLNKKLPNLKESDIRTVKSKIAHIPTINRHSNAIKRNSPIGKNKRNPRFRESKGTYDSGGEGKKCSDSGKNTGGNQSGNSGGNVNSNQGEGSHNSSEHGNRSDGNSNERDNQQPGCSRQNDDSRDSSDQSSVPFKHSIAQLTSDTGTQDKSVQFHHLFLVQQEYNNIPQHMPSRQNILLENEAMVTKLDKPPLHFNHGGTMDPLGQKCKTNKPRKGLNDCIAMLKNKLVDPIQSSQQVSVQCLVEEPLTNNSNNAKSDKPNQLPKTSTPKITHEIAVQCADLDDEDTLADALLKELRRQGLPSTSQKDKGKGKVSKQRNDKLMKETNDINNHESIKNKVPEQKPTIEKELEAQPSTSGLQRSVSPGFTKGDPKHIKKSRDIIPVHYAQEKMEAQQSATSNQDSVPSDVTKGSLKKIKKSQNNLPVTQERLEAQHNTSSIEQFLPPDSSKDSLKSTKKMENLTPVTQEKLKLQQSTTSNQLSVLSDVTKGSLKKIKKSQNNLPVTHEILEAQHNTSSIEQFVPPDSSKDSLKSTKKMESLTPVTQEKLESGQSPASNQQSVPSKVVKGSKKNIIKKSQNNLPLTCTQDKIDSQKNTTNFQPTPITQEKLESQQSTTSNQLSVPSDVTKGSLKNIKKSQNNLSVTYTREILEAQHNTSSIRQSVPPDSSKDSLKSTKKMKSLTPITDEKLESQQSTKSNQLSVPSGVAKGSLKNIKKSQDILPVTYTYEILESQHNTTDSSKDSLKSTKKMESVTPVTQEKIESEQSTASNQQSVPSEVIKGSKKNTKRSQNNLPVTYTQDKIDSQQNTTNFQQSVFSDIKASLRNVKKSQDIMCLTYTQEKNEAQQNITSSHQSISSNINTGSLKKIKKGRDSVPQMQEKSKNQQSTTSTQNSVSSNVTNGSLKNIKKSQDTVPETSLKNIKNCQDSVPQTQEKSETQQSNTNTQNSVSSNVTDGSLENIKKSQYTIPVTYTQEKINSQQKSTTIQQCVPSDVTESFLKTIKKNQRNIPANYTQEKPSVSNNTNNNHQFVPSNATKGSFKNIKKRQYTIPISYTEETSDAQQKSKSTKQFVATEVNKVFSKNDKKGQDINSVSYTQEKSEPQSVCQNTALHSVHQSDSYIVAKTSMKNYEKAQDIIPITQDHEKSEAQQNTTGTQQSIKSNVAKGYLKNIKKGLDIVPRTHTQEKIEVKQCSTYQQSISPDCTKGSLKNIRKSQDIIPVPYTQSSNLDTSSSEKYIDSIPKNIKERQKSDSNSLNISNRAPEQRDSSSSPKEDIIRLEKEKKMELIQTKRQNEYDERHLLVGHSSTETVNKTLDTNNYEQHKTLDTNYEQHKIINVGNVNLMIDDNLYNSEPGPHDRTIQNLCQDMMSINEHSLINSDIPPAHCNIQIEPILTSPLDLSGKISSTQSDSPVSYPVPIYENNDNYETLDLSNKNPNRNFTQNTAFIDEDVVDLRIKYTSTMHYESDLSTTSSFPDMATDLSLGNEQFPKDLSLKGRNRSFSKTSTITNSECINMASCHYDSCSSEIYEENACLDFSLKESVHTNNPTDLSGRRDNRTQHIDNLSGIESRVIEHNEIHESDLATNLSVCNRMNLHASINSITSYEPLHIITGEMSSHLNRHIVNPTIISTDIDIVSEDMYEPVSNAHHTKNNRTEERDNPRVSPEIEMIDTGITLITSKELTRDHFIPLIANKSTYMDTSVINEIPIYTKERISPYPFTNIPLCLSETITTSLPAYNFKNRTLVTPSSKYESTTPVYTLANACISVTKIESTSSATLTNMLLSIPGNTITNTTSVYTLAGTTIGTPINYNPGSNPLSINNDTSPSFKTADNNTESPQNPDVIDKSITIIRQEKEKVDDVRETRAERVGTNLDQDTDIAKKIALLPKELVEILGTMPLDHRKQLLNVLPQYVSTSMATSGPSTDNGKEFITKSKDEQVSPLPHIHNSKQIKEDVTLEKRQNMLNPTPPPSTLPHSVSQLSPSSVSSSFLLTPPTPNFKSRSLNTAHRNHTAVFQNSPEKDRTMLANIELPLSKISTNTDLKVIDLCEPVIDLTGDDNSQSIPEGEVHTTSEASVQALSPKTVTLFTAVKGAALKTNNDKTASLRAVRIKTQSERHKTAYPKSQTREDSTEIPVTSSNPDDIKKSFNNNKSLTIQQGEITSTQHVNRHIITEDQISSSVSINNEQFEQKNDCDTHTGKKDCYVSVEHKDVREIFYEVSSEIPENTKTENACSTNFGNDDFVYKETKLENSACVTTASSPVQSETIISNNNNVVSCKYDSENKTKSQEPDVNSQHNRKISEDDDSDDDVSLAAIVKQRNSDRTVDKSDTQSVAKLEKLKSNEDQIITSVPSVEVTDMSTDLISTNVNHTDLLFSQSARNPADQSHNDTINIEAKDKNKKKGRKGRRNNNLITPKNVEQPTNDEFDINKENTVTSESENIKYKDENIKLKIIERDISPCNNVKETVSTNQSYKDNTELHDERNLVEREISLCNSSQADTPKNIDEANEQERVVLLTYDQTLNKNSTNKPNQDNLNRHDINSQKLPLIPIIVTKKIEFKTPVNNIIKENTDTDVVNPNKKITFETKTKTTAESSSENLQVLNEIEATSMEQTTITPLRRSRRGKSLFIDSNIITKDSPSSSDNILEHKMPLTKKQLIFSKLLLDEEHNGPSIPSNIEKIEKNDDAETKQIVQDTARSDDDSTTVIQNDATDSDFDQHTSQSPIKTNKRKKSSQIKKKNKKKKLHQDCLLSNSNTDLNLPHDNDITLKDNVKTLSIENSHSGLRKSSECLSETQNQEQIPLDKSKELNKDFYSISSQEKALEKAASIEKRKPDISIDIDALAGSKPKKSKGYDDIINQNEKICKKDLLKPDTTISDYKAKTRTTTCYNKPVAARRARSKSVFVNSVPEYYDPYDIDLEEMNEISETMNRKIALRKSSNALKTPNSTVTSTSNKSELNNKGLSGYYDAVPSTSKNETTSMVQLQKNEWLREIDYKELNTSTSLNKETTDSDDSSKSDIPLKKYVEEKEKKMLDSNENINKHKDTNDHNKSGNMRTRKKNKRGTVTNKKPDDTKTQSQDNEAQLRSEQFMESFGFFSERKPRKSNLLATKKISETLNKIANETDDVYFGIKERSTKRTADKRHLEEDNNRGTTSKESKQDKKAAKRSRKKKSITLIECTYCQICKKEFRRSDNYLRHQMSLLHISKLAEVELNVKTTPVEEEPNHLIAYKLQIDRVKILHDKIAKRKKNSLPTNDIILPTIEEILANVKSTIREQQHYCRGLSRDEELFIDCCELLKESHTKNVRRRQKIRHCNSFNCRQASANELEIFEINIEDRIDDKSDGDVDSITARNIMESDEVRNLENDLISGLKEAANANKFNENHLNFHHLNEILRRDIITIQPSCSSVKTNYNHVEKQDKLEESKVKPKRSPEYKEKMYPDIIENIDMFEDKFDKIKRKCRSQAAAASKQSQAVPEASSSHKVRKNKKKGKKKAKNHQSTVMTKGALKGFEGIKVSIVTTEINMSAIMPPLKKSSKKKKKNQSKKKREKKSTEMNNIGSDEPRPKNIDVYEFMDTDDAEVFDFRPSTIMERFKSISNKDIPSTSKNIGKYNEVEISSDSASDGDDFVYMSDDYVCSEDETENSIMSCELRNVSEPKKSSPFKRKDATEKSAVMGKIFKNNAVRSEKKNSKNKDIDKPKANLDQLFDSLLEEQQHSLKHVSETVTSQSSELSRQRYCKSPSPKQSNKSDFYEYEDSHHDDEDNNVFKKSIKLSTPDDTDMRSFSTDKVISSSKKRRSVTPPKKCNISQIKFTNEDHLKNTQKHKDSDIYSQLSLKKYDRSISNDLAPKFSRKHDVTPSPESFGESNDAFNYNAYKSKDKCEDKIKIKSSFKLHEKEKRASFDCHAESLDALNLSDDGGVARQRVRRKCAVGKQNVLAETWSSESEPDGMPPRPNSAESVVGGGRRRKGRKKEGHSSGNKKGNSKIPRKNDFESRVYSKCRNASSSEVIECIAGGSRSGIVARSSGGFARPGQSFISHAGTSNSSSAKSRPRPPPYYWSEGDDEQEHLQQHGWIVGDSHKKLVTMLAHAKGRKRNNDEKRHVVE